MGLLVGFMSNPLKTYWQARLCILQYYKSKLDVSIFYARDQDLAQEVSFLINGQFWIGLVTLIQGNLLQGIVTLLA